MDHIPSRPLLRATPLLLALCLFVAGALLAQTEAGPLTTAEWWRPWLSPVVLVALGLGFWRGIGKWKAADDERWTKVQSEIVAVRVALVGYDHQGGILSDIRSIKKEQDHVVSWAREVGLKSHVFFDRRRTSEES